MRILFCTWAWQSHLFPMVPLAWACRAAGHQVRVASQPGLMPVIRQAGLDAVSVGRDVDVPGFVRDYVLRPGGRPQGRPRALDMLVELADAMVDDLVGQAERWRPDVIVYELTTWAGPLAAAAIGVPAVRMLYGVDLLERAAGFLPDAIGPLAERLGLPEVDVHGGLTVDPCPPRLQVSTGYRPQEIRYVPYNGAGTVPSSIPDRGSRPRVCVTWGTTMAKLESRRMLAERMAKAVAVLDAEIVVAIAEEHMELLTGLPDDVRVLTGVPLDLVLPSCDLVLHHGGAGTTLTAMTHGVPQLVIPQLPDHALHGRQLAATGAGRVIAKEDAEPESVREAVTALLAESGHRESAAALATESRLRPPPADVVHVLEKLAAERE
ncbi:nucleotide disphospho-sugar-binding domain-containing protein [Amycolatopsis coloradensis]|uniref:Nucleotide disphospho-sugar-binding domain-containing protein n=1 Tax=Amycolatopsis coloradensis TaxID=76021 RepID=A0ACD5BJJ1_9PSEU